MTVVRDITGHRELLERQARKTVLNTQKLMLLQKGFDFFPENNTLKTTRVNADLFLKKVRFVIRLMSGDKVKCSIVIETGMANFIADEKELQSAIMKIITNSLESMTDEGELVLQAGIGQMSTGQDEASPTYRPVSCVNIEIRDTGCGMNDELILRIFEPFFTTKSRDYHKGLGLTEALSGISAMNGEISVKSSRGKGSNFVISLPVV